MKEDMREGKKARQKEKNRKRNEDRIGERNNVVIKKNQGVFKS
jgi:hypothetical protein